MLKHENPNIEVINKNLWAVRFSLIPFIPQISYKPDPSVPLEQVPGGFPLTTPLKPDHEKGPSGSSWKGLFCVFLLCY